MSEHETLPNRYASWERALPLATLRIGDRFSPVGFLAWFVAGLPSLFVSHWLIAAYGLLLLAMGITDARSILRARRDDLRDLEDDPCPVPQFWVDVAIRRDGVFIGTDTGVVTFVDGWLHFSGTRTSFALWASRCSKVRPIAVPWSPLGRGHGYSFGLHLLGSPLDVSFRSRGEKQLEGMFGAWVVDRRAPREMTLPPRSVQSTVLPWLVWNLTVGTLAVGAGTVLAVGMAIQVAQNNLFDPPLFEAVAAILAIWFWVHGFRRVSDSLISIVKLRGFTDESVDMPDATHTGLAKGRLVRIGRSNAD